MTALEAAARAATSVQDWAETTVCIMSSRSEGIAHQAKLILTEFAPLLAAKDAEIDFERGLTDKARETIERLAAENAELKRDAERWRYVRDHLDANANPRGMSWSITIPAERGSVLFYKVEDAIDAALAQKSQNEHISQ